MADKHQHATRSRGDMVGVMALLTDEPRPADVVAATDVELWRLQRDCFALLVEEHHELQEFLTGLVCHRLESPVSTADLAIGKYTIDYKLGQGAWAIVYLGLLEANNLTALVAHKLSYFIRPGGLANDKDKIATGGQKDEIWRSLCQLEKGFVNAVGSWRNTLE
jgi:hypothetical protein